MPVTLEKALGQYEQGLLHKGRTWDTISKIDNALYRFLKNHKGAHLTSLNSDDLHDWVVGQIREGRVLSSLKHDLGAIRGFWVWLKEVYPDKVQVNIVRSVDLELFVGVEQYGVVDKIQDSVSHGFLWNR